MPWASSTGPQSLLTKHRLPGRAAGSSPGNRQPALGPAGAGHKHDRFEARPRKAQPGIDIRVPARVGLEVTRTDIPDSGGAVRADAKAADNNPEGRKRVRAAH